MCNVLERVVDAVSIVIGRVDAPLATSVRVRNVSDSVCHEISHVRVDMLHVNLNSETAFILSEFALSHLIEKIEVLFNSAVSER